MPCKVHKKQYTGKTVDRFRSRWNDYKESDRKLLRSEEIKQKSLHQHFLSEGHQSFEDEVSICVIDKTDPSDPHKKEYYWMRALKTISPFGLNTEETYWAVNTITCFSSVRSVLLLLKVCKSDFCIVTLLLHFYFLVLYVTYNVKGKDWIIWNWIVKGIEQFSISYFVGDVAI